MTFLEAVEATGVLVWGAMKAVVVFLALYAVLAFCLQAYTALDNYNSQFTEEDAGPACVTTA